MEEFALALSAASFEPPAAFKLKGHLQRPRSVAIAAENPMAVSTSKDKTVRVWDLVGQRKLGRLLHDAEFIYDVAVTASGSLIAGAGSDGILYFWLWPQTEPAAKLQGHTGGVFCVRLSPNGQQLITGGRDAAVGVWDIDSGEIIQRLDTDGDGFTSLLFTPDGRRLISRRVLHRHDDRDPEDDPMMAIWDVPSGQLLKHFPGGEAVTCNPDGNYILYSAMDNTLRALKLSELLGSGSSP